MTDRDARDRATRGLPELVLGAPAEFTREQAAAAAGITVEEARPYWRAMGFPDVGVARVFTARDVQALRQVVDWVSTGRLDEPTTLEIVRSMGQTASRLADWQVDTMARVLADAEDPIDLDAVVDGISEVLPGLDLLLVHAWRRHLAAVIGRGLSVVDDAGDPVEAASATVGFADIAGFTRLTRVMADEDLALLVASFETGAADIVAGHAARLVKTLGDEVMFVADAADAAVAIASDMHDMALPGDDPINLRIGLATGRLITRMGDIYGGTVNRASRLTAIARPGTTVLDSATEEALVDSSTYLLRHQPPRPLRGLGLVRATTVVRRRA